MSGVLNPAAAVGPAGMASFAAGSTGFSGVLGIVYGPSCLIDGVIAVMLTAESLFPVLSGAPAYAGEATPAPAQAKSDPLSNFRLPSKTGLSLVLAGELNEFPAVQSSAQLTL